MHFEECVTDDARASGLDGERLGPYVFIMVLATVLLLVFG